MIIMGENVKFRSISKSRKVVKKEQFFIYEPLKRICEIIASIILLIVLFPIFLIVSVLILITSGKPIFFLQKRVGKNGIPFTIWKFRTMKQNNSTNELNTTTWVQGVPDEFVFKSAPSSHTTRIGIWLRKYSIDELPQFINILKGEMSFVGPRPEALNIANYYNDYQKMRLLVKPGITGYAQINGRSNMNHGQKIKYDLYYVNNQSFLLDLKIILLTIIKVMKTDGAI